MRVPVCGEVIKFIVITQHLLGNKFIRTIYTGGQVERGGGAVGSGQQEDVEELISGMSVRGAGRGRPVWCCVCGGEARRGRSEGG